MRGYLIGIIFLLVASPASAFFIVDEKGLYQAEADYHAPILFIPGVMGSILEDDNRWTTSDELWPGNPQEDRMELAFQADGKTPEVEGSKITALKVLRKAWGSDIYDPFYREMDKTIYKYNGQQADKSYLGQAYFDRAYDFRRTTEEQIPGLEKKIDEILKNTHSKKIILVGHSMGSLQAKKFASENPDKVRAVILLSGPLNGAPRGFESLTEGYNFGAGPLITINHVWEIGHNWPGILHLSPNHPFATTTDGKALTLEQTFTQGINFQQARHIPSEAFAKLEAAGITNDPAKVTAELQKEFSGVSKTIVKQTADFRAKFDTLQTPASVRVELIHGYGQNTTQSFIVYDELFTSTHKYVSGYSTDENGLTVTEYSPYQFTIRRFRQVNNNEGDETVHKKGFEWASATKVQSVNAGHMVMAGIPETNAKMMAIIEELNHDKRDKAWIERIKFITETNLESVKQRAPAAEEQSQAYGEAVKEENKKKEKDGLKIIKLIGDIRGRGSVAFIDSMIAGNQNNIQIVVPDLGEYDEKNKDFKAYVVLDSYNLVDANIGKIAPATYVVTIDKETFLALMSNQMTLREAWKAEKITISGGIKERLLGWIGKWVTKYTSGD